MNKKEKNKNLNFILIIILSIIGVLIATQCSSKRVLALTYNVEFFDGEKSTIVEVEENDTVKKIKDPEKKNNQFLYWIDYKTQKEFDFKTPITENKRLVAEWANTKNSNMQKDVAKMIKKSDKSKDSDIFGLNAEIKPDYLKRLTNPKFIVAAIVGMFIFIFVAGVAIKTTKNEKKEHKEKESKEKQL